MRTTQRLRQQWAVLLDGLRVHTGLLCQSFNKARPKFTIITGADGQRLAQRRKHIPCGVPMRCISLVELHTEGAFYVIYS